MNCPVDGTTLVMADRQGVEIDYCPQCRGVWLDRGELDKVVARAEDDRGRADVYPFRRYDDDDDYHRFSGHRRKKRGFLSELFDD